MTLADALNLIKTLVQDTAAKLEPEHYEAALKKALSYYSQFRPNVASQTIPCGANGKILASAITNFDEGFVEQMKIEYPIILRMGAPYWLDDDDWSYEQEDAGPLIRFIGVVPPLGANVRIVHRIKHVLPADPDDSLTVRESDTEAVCEWAAAEALQMLSRLYTQTVDKMPQVDFANFQNRGGDYQSRANVHKRAFYDHLNAAGRREYSEVALVRG
jgi:hypothetical protein